MSACPCCIEAGPIRWASVNLLKCARCGHIWQNVVGQTVDYGAEYIERGYAARKVPTENMAWVRLAFMYLFVKSGRVLDIGYGDGAFVKTARKVGYDAYGYDVHADAPEGVPTVDKLDRGFDVVTMFDSFEHFRALTQPFLTRPEWFFVTVPHTPKNIGEATIEAWRHFKPNEHLHYFSTDSIRRIFTRFGYELLSQYPIEDIIRKNPACDPNTMTYVFKRHT